MFPKNLLAQQHIVVTGAAGLLGQSIVNYCLKAGAKVTGLDLSDPEIKDLNFIQLDVCDLKQIEDFLAQSQKEVFQGWVNAAYPRTEDWGRKDPSHNYWNKNMQMQLTSVCETNELVAKTLISQKNASIVNLASIYGILGPKFDIYDNTDMTMPAPYAAIKGGIINFTRFMASKYGKDHIRVNCVSPGGILDQQPESFVKNYSQKTMLQRMGQPEEIAACIAFLLSDQASYITGQNLIVDGGWSAM